MSEVGIEKPRRFLLRVLGRFAVGIDGESPGEIRISSRKGCAMLAYLAMHPDHRATREHLAAFFWGDRQDAQARHSLRQCLLALRRDLSMAASGVIIADASTVGLETRLLTIDAVELARLAGSRDPSDAARAAALYGGEFMCDFNLEEPFDSWLQKTRSQLAGVAAGVLKTCAEGADASGDEMQAITAVERLIALDPFHEDWQRLALRLYARYRGRDAAMKHAHALAAILQRELGVDLEPATRTLIDEIKARGISAVAGAHPPAAPTVAAVDLSTRQSVARPVEAPRRIPPPKSLAQTVMRGCRYAKRQPLVFGPALGFALLIGVLGLSLLAQGHAPWAGGPRTAIADAFLGGAMRNATMFNGGQAVRAVVPVLVLPFTTSDPSDTATQRIADVVSGNVIDALSLFAGLQVVSHETAFLYKGRAADAETLAAELGVRYIVEGNVTGDKSRDAIAVELVDASNRMQVWSDRVERDDLDRLTGQDELVARLARELEIAVIFAEGARRTDAAAREPSADDLVLEGLAVHFRGPSRENAAEELGLFEQALRREPDLPPALLGESMALLQAVQNSLADDPERSLERAEALLDRILRKDTTSSRAYYWEGMVLAARGRYDAALESLMKCVELNPGAVVAHAEIGKVLVRLGRPDEGLDHIQHAIRLSPKDSAVGFFYLFAGEAELELRHDEAAAEWFRRAIVSQPGNPMPYKYLAATYALMGDKPNAARSWDDFRRLSAPSALGRLVEKLRMDVASGTHHGRSRLHDGLSLMLAS